MIEHGGTQLLTVGSSDVNVATCTVASVNWPVRFHRAGLGALVLGLVTLSAGSPVTTVLADKAHSNRHVLLLSVDGLHAFDLNQ